MKKTIIAILEIVTMIILILIISSKYLSYFNKKTIIILKQTDYQYYDGKATEYT